jgi:hypothetical protein
MNLSDLFVLALVAAGAGAVMWWLISGWAEMWAAGMF